jgi:O-antigen ligase
VAAPTEIAPTPTSPAPPTPRRARPHGGARSRLPALTSGAQWWPTLIVAAIFCWITFYTAGGLKLESMTFTEIALTLGAGALIAACVLLAPGPGRAYGVWPTGLLLAFTALTALSIVWSVQPDHSWQDSGRLLAYSGVFGAGVALARCCPRRWPAILGGLTLAASIVCGYAVTTKVFPSLDPANTFARLNEPFGYWNAVGLSAAMGVICSMWLGARRDGHALLRALAYPATGLLALALVLAYSRGALAALALGVVLWFCIVPLRLRGAAVLILGALGAAAVAAWDFSNHALSSENIPIAQRASAGHELGVLVLTMLVLLSIAGIAIGFRTGIRPPSARARRRAGAALLAAIVLALLAFAGALAHSQRGFTGTISHTASTLTNPDAKLPPDTPGRLTAVASVRARYWKEALQVFDAHPFLGAGAEGYAIAHLRYETGTLEVRHAHGFIVQTLADLGVAGLALALALLCSWLICAIRVARPHDRGSYTPERIGMLSMLCLVVVFGLHSLIDWTWYVPDDACAALLCAGWLAGRGPLHASRSAAEHTARPARVRGERASALKGTLARAGAARVCVASAVIVAALLSAWSQWQPQRSEEASQQALAQLASYRYGAAEASADSAVARDPLSSEALFTLAGVQQARGRYPHALATLERAVRRQPSNPQTWLALARYQLARDPAAAVPAFQAAVYLDPQSISQEAIAAGVHEAIEIHNQYIRALEAVQRSKEREARASEARAVEARARRVRAFKNASEARARAAARARRATRRRQ